MPREMCLIEVFLPLSYNDGKKIERSKFVDLEENLISNFGGVTVYARSPAFGSYDDGEQRQRDEIVVVEVMTEKFDREWWLKLREELERSFEQKEILIRFSSISQL
ncbi:hypothetical protein J2W51_001573 [Tardiphaga robiniae]|uniref:hypothetical protein n=1 Tax=Nitrobacteraceae TaxID=41294 RepID=UPI00111435A7|nr:MULTISPECIES: hypothetical protein [Nitrobacteraceae]MDR6659031.1 hypothetical protein [Tardiphaga robiniae]